MNGSQTVFFELMDFHGQKSTLDHQTSSHQDAKDDENNHSGAQLFLFFFLLVFYFGNGFLHSQSDIQRLRKSVAVGIFTADDYSSGMGQSSERYIMELMWTPLSSFGA